MSRVMTGLQLDEFGRPMRALWRQEDPRPGRTSALNGTPQYSGRLVVALSTAHEERLAQRAYKARRKAS